MNLDLRNSLCISFFFFVFFVGINGAFSQSAKKNQQLFDKASQAYHSGQIQEAINYAGQLIKNDSTYVNAYLFLADVYRQLDSISSEIKYLKQASAIANENMPLIWFHLGEALFSDGQYPQAIEAYIKSSGSSKVPSKRESYIARKIDQCHFAIDCIAQPNASGVLPLEGDVNTPFDEYWPSQTVDEKHLVFTRLLPDSLWGRGWQEDLYMAELVKGQWLCGNSANELNTPDNEGAQTISADGNLLFFTACNRQDGQGSCDIYLTIKKNGKWQAPVNAGGKVNTHKWESQPSLSPNSEYLYFSSDREGGFGQKDIWRVKINAFDDQGMPVWGQAQNLGDSINTPGTEVSPFIHFDNRTLYFSSDNWLGLGGSDVFCSTSKGGNLWSKPVNMGYPINTHKNEKGFIVDASGENAYFSSERTKGQGLDIFTAKLAQQVQPNPVTYVSGKITDSETQQPLMGSVDIYDISKKHFTCKLSKFKKQW